MFQWDEVIEKVKDANNYRIDNEINRWKSNEKKKKNT